MRLLYHETLDQSSNFGDGWGERDFVQHGRFFDELSMTKFKTPEVIIETRELPRNLIDEVLKTELRERIGQQPIVESRLIWN
jgi:hypothetical protein